MHLTWAMVPDSVEYAEWKTGHRADGLIYSTLSFVQKLDTGIGGALIGVVLSAVAYRAPIQGVIQAQSQETIFGFLFLTTVAPAVGGVISLLFMSQYRLDGQLHDQLNEMLNKQRLVSQESVS